LPKEDFNVLLELLDNDSDRLPEDHRLPFRSRNRVRGIIEVVEKAGRSLMPNGNDARVLFTVADPLVVGFNDVLIAMRTSAVGAEGYIQMTNQKKAGKQGYVCMCIIVLQYNCHLVCV
jgi:hypothetical protein